MPTLHVIPLNDERDHEVCNCWCDPEIRWIDPDTGLPYPGGAMCIHNSADCRESVERLLEQGLGEDKRWATVIDHGYSDD